MDQFENVNLDLKMKIMVVEDDAVKRKIIRDYFRQSRRENTIPLDAQVMPEAIFWLKS